MKFHHSVLGGTFDHLHSGHKYFIGAAYENTNNLTIGLVRKLLGKKSFAETVEDYDTRKKALEKWLSDENKTAEIIPIDDIWGNSTSGKNLDSIFVTRHGLPNAKLINKKRTEKGFNTLKITTVDFLKGGDGRIISSTGIRSGIIDRTGFPYVSIFKNTLLLPENMRAEIKTVPSGVIINSDQDLKKAIQDKRVIAVGDVISERLLSMGIKADISVIDYRVQRKPIKQTIKGADFSIVNRSGSISKSAAHAIRKAINLRLKTGHPKIIKVIGEEDLISLACVLLAPLGWVVLYGMPNEGAVFTEVTEAKKEEVKNALVRFDRAI